MMYEMTVNDMIKAKSNAWELVGWHEMDKWEEKF